MSDILEIPVRRPTIRTAARCALLELNLRHEAGVQGLMLFALASGCSAFRWPFMLATDFVAGLALVLALWGAGFIGVLLQALSCARLRVLLERGRRRAGAKRIKTTS